MDLFTDTQIHDALDALPEQFRLAVLLADVEGFSYKEIAEILGVPIGTVMSRLHRGRRALQKSLYGYARDQGVVRGDPKGAKEPVPGFTEEGRAESTTS